MIGVEFVDAMLDGDLCRGGRQRVIIQARAAETQQRCLGFERQSGLGALEQPQPLIARQRRGQIFFSAS